VYIFNFLAQSYPTVYDPLSQGKYMIMIYNVSFINRYLTTQRSIPTANSMSTSCSSQVAQRTTICTEDEVFPVKIVQSSINFTDIGYNKKNWFVLFSPAFQFERFITAGCQKEMGVCRDFCNKKEFIV
jgi:hypothetical protein